MPVFNDYSHVFIVNNQKWLVRFTPYCFILATDKIKIVFDYPDNKLPIYSEEIDNNVIIGIFKTELYTMHVSTTNKESGSIDMVGMLVDKLLPSFTFPIPYEIADGIQKMGQSKEINLETNNNVESMHKL